MELTLVAALILVVSALAVPSLKGMYGYYKANGAVDAVRAGLAQARARAIEEGRPYRFALMANGSRYRVAPDDPSFWSGIARRGVRGRGGALEGTLPQGVTFSVQESGMASSMGGWSAPVVFLPDGSAEEDVAMLFRVQGAQPRIVALRALTGVVTTRILGSQSQGVRR